MLKELFKKTKYITVSTTPLKPVNKDLEQKSNNPNIPSGMWVKCYSCGSTLYNKDLDENYNVCHNCGAHFRISAPERIKMLIDAESFVEFDKEMTSTNPLNFKDYEGKVKAMQDKSGINEAVITGRGTIEGEDLIIAVMDSSFMMGSMGSVVGEKLTRAVEKATELKLPIVIFTASGGARMQEGMFSLMQMAKVSAAIARHDESGQLYVTVLTDPTTGGVTASFAMLGDIILSEPGALIGFAGRRVIEQTIKQKLPDSFQKAEFLLKHGFVDKIVSRDNMRKTLHEIFIIHRGSH